MILQVNFQLDMPAAEYQGLVDSIAPAFCQVPGLRWKIWVLNLATREAGGLYLFESQVALEGYLAGPLVARLRALPSIRNVSVKQFEVMPEATALTGGLFALPGAA